MRRPSAFLERLGIELELGDVCDPEACARAVDGVAEVYHLAGFVSRRPLPWPHYFVDLSGIGGSAPPDQPAVLLAICGQVAAQAAGATVPRCTRPELAVLNR